MKKRLLLYVTLLTLSAGPAWAAGLNLAWVDCPSGGGTLLRTFACASNSGTNTLVASYVAPDSCFAVSANELVLDIQTGAPGVVPDWWNLRAGACRPTSLLVSADFSALSACVDYWGGFASVGGSQDVIAVPGNRNRIKGLAALPSGHAQIGPIAEGTEVYSFIWRINNLKSTGSGACAGCSEEACIVLNSIKINQPLGPPAEGLSRLVTSPAANQHVIWQAWTAVDENSCPLVTPVRQQTWGSIKALYR